MKTLEQELRDLIEATTSANVGIVSVAPIYPIQVPPPRKRRADNRSRLRRSAA